MEKPAIQSVKPTTLIETPTTSGKQTRWVKRKAKIESRNIKTNTSQKPTPTSVQQQQQHKMQQHKYCDRKQLNICKQRVEGLEDALESLWIALCHLEERVEDMQKEEEVEDRMWRYTLELISIKYSIPPIQTKYTVSEHSEGNECSQGALETEDSPDHTVGELSKVNECIRLPCEPIADQNNKEDGFFSRDDEI